MFSSLKYIAIALVLAQAFDPIEDPESICGTDQAQTSICIKDIEPTKYSLRRAVARLPVNRCTGWLWGSEGHLLTNHHCIGSVADALKTKVEMDAECDICGHPDSKEPLGCPGVIIADSTTFLYANKTLDFALVKLNLNPGVSLKEYGFLQARDGPAIFNETIHIIEHPKRRPKHHAYLNDDGTPARITTLAAKGCTTSNPLGYNADTEGGSSGSPVFGTSDNLVIGLHNCGGCHGNRGENSGNHIDQIIAELRENNLLPADAIATKKPSC